MLHSDSTSARQIPTNLVYNECTKHFEVDCHFTGEKIQNKFIKVESVLTYGQLADFLTKAVPRRKLSNALSKLAQWTSMQESSSLICISRKIWADL